MATETKIDQIGEVGWETAGKVTVDGFTRQLTCEFGGAANQDQP